MSSREIFLFLRTCFRSAVSFVFPYYCAYCRTFLQTDDVLCERCLARLRPIVSMPLRLTKKKSLSVFAISDYEYPLRSLVQAKQYGNRLASQQLGRLLWEQTQLSQISFDIVVPIPLHWRRYAWRGFNQSHEMAQVVATLSGKPLVKLLKRPAHTIFQAGLSRVERTHNVQDVFALTDQAYRYRGSSVLFIDDVMTTGSTLFAACKAIAPVCPKNLYAAVACRVISK